MSLPRTARRAIAGLVIASICVASVLFARRSRADSMSDPGLQGRSQGPAGAAVLLVEYSDFQCPSCKYARPYVEQLIKQYGKEVRFVFRHFPLQQHQRAYGAAVAAECASYQGKFWAYHDVLFDKQEDWVAAADPRILFAQYAENLKLSVADFQQCLEGTKAPAAIQRDIGEGGAWQVNSTPTLFVGHRRLVGAKQIQLYGPGLIEKGLKGAQ